MERLLQKNIDLPHAVPTSLFFGANSLGGILNSVRLAVYSGITNVEVVKQIQICCFHLTFTKHHYKKI